MRIGFLSHQWPGVRLGGVGAYTGHCARGLAAAWGGGNDVLVFTFTLPADVRKVWTGVKGLEIREVKTIAERVAEGMLPGELAAATQAGGGGGEGVYRMAMASLLCEAVRAEHERNAFDVVEGPEYEALGLPLLMGGFDGTVVTHVHSGSAIARVGGNAWAAASEEQSLIEKLEWAAMERADGLCAATGRVVQDTAAAYGAERLPGNVEVVPLPFLETGGAFTEAPAGGGEGAVLYVGRLEFLKGAHLVGMAANEFLRRNPEAVIRLAGPDTATAPNNEGSMAGWIKKQVAAEVAERVVFLGECDRARIREELKGCAFVVAPSLFDNYPYVCCEAMAAGRAVVTSAGIGAAELVGGGGVTFERGNAAALASAMERLWRERELRGQLGRAAFERMRGELSAEVAIRQRVEMYQRVIARKKTRGAAGAGEPILKALLDLTGFVAGAPAKTMRKTPGMRMAEVLDAAGNGKAVEVVLYGAGRHTTRLMAEKHLWESRGHRVVGIIDDHPRFVAEPEFLKLPVMSREAAEKMWVAGRVVVLSTDTFEEQFWGQMEGLRGRGVRVLKLYGS